jgi:hypothetical protein
MKMLALNPILFAVAVVSLPLGYGQRLLIHRVGSGPFYTTGELIVFITYARQIVGLALLFTAVFSLSKTKGQTTTLPKLRNL